MQPIDKALAELSLQDRRIIAQLAEKYGMDRSTLSRRWAGKTAPKEQGIENRSLLNNKQTQTLISYINELSDRGLPPTDANVRNFAEDISQKRPGKNWVYRWVDKFKKQLKSDYLMGLDLCRKKADNHFDYFLYFELVCKPLLRSYN
jgi:transcriptional regulator with XRE-family HTH domain